jgi:protein-L-isoaspartate(D-aspartate) O-methyltransferase
VSAEARARMVERQIARRGVADPRVLEAMRTVPREPFVPEHLRVEAYEDRALPIGEGQTISQPYVVALMLEALELSPDDRVLEVGVGSGYAAALLGHLTREVFGIERQEALARAAAARLAAPEYANVHVVAGDGTLGWPEKAPFDGILVSAGGPEVPSALLEQLVDGGRLVMPVGDEGEAQELLKIVREGPGRLREESLGKVQFVPLIWDQGWHEDDGSSGTHRTLE